MKKVIKQNIDLTKPQEEQLSELYGQAAIAKTAMDEAGSVFAEGIGVSYVTIPLKKTERAKEKTFSNFDGDASRLTDIVRCSFVCDTYERMLSVSKKLQERFCVKVEEDTMKSPDKNKPGFRCITLAMQVKGHIIEAQVVLKDIYDVVPNSRPFYLERRRIKALIAAEKREMTQEEESLFQLMSRSSRDIYDNALVYYNSKTKGEKIKLYRDSFPLNSRKKKPLQASLQ